MKQQENTISIFKECNEPEDRKVRDNCHYTGLYPGTAHNNCNQKSQIPECIDLIFHNLHSYDTHLFMKMLGKEVNKDENNIAENIVAKKEKYIKIYVKLAGLNKDS